MKYNEFTNEMTMQAGSYEGLGRYISQYESLLQVGSHVGDIENFSVFKGPDKYNRYAAFNGNQIIAYWQISDSGTLKGIYVLPEYRRQGLFSAILFFLKRNEGYNKITLDEYQSNDTVEAIKRIYKRFENVYWEKDGVKMPYSPETINDFYSLSGPTGWVIVLEHNGTSLGKKKFFDHIDLGTWYFNLLDE